MCCEVSHRMRSKSCLGFSWGLSYDHICGPSRTFADLRGRSRTFAELRGASRISRGSSRTFVDLSRTFADLRGPLADLSRTFADLSRTVADLRGPSRRCFLGHSGPGRSGPDFKLVRSGPPFASSESGPGQTGPGQAKCGNSGPGWVTHIPDTISPRAINPMHITTKRSSPGNNPSTPMHIAATHHSCGIQHTKAQAHKSISTLSCQTNH